jgi:hypothetical protein
MKYFVIPNTRDGCDSPTQPVPVELAQVGEHIQQWLGRFKRQGYFSNCKQERIPLGAISFRVEPAFSHQPRTTKATV